MTKFVRVFISIMLVGAMSTAAAGWLDDKEADYYFSQRTGITVKSLQSILYALNQTGSSITEEQLRTLLSDPNGVRTIESLGLCVYEDASRPAGHPSCADIEAGPHQRLAAESEQIENQLKQRSAALISGGDADSPNEGRERELVLEIEQFEASLEQGFSEHGGTANDVKQMCDSLNILREPLAEGSKTLSPQEQEGLDAAGQDTALRAKRQAVIADERNAERAQLLAWEASHPHKYCQLSRLQRQEVGAPLAPTAATVVTGPSFDCSKARSKSERLICSDPELAQLDVQLAALYRQAKAVAVDKASFRQTNSAEWKRREATCTDRDCLIAWYAHRRDQLDEVIRSSSTSVSNVGH